MQGIPVLTPLTNRQTEILSFVQTHVREVGYPPSRADIAQHFRMQRSSAAEHLQAIEKKGYLELTSDARGIRLTPANPIPDAFTLPIVGRIAAGSPITAEENSEETLKIDPDFFRPRADFLHRVCGHSMRKIDIRDGDVVGIHAQSEAECGQIIAACMLDRKSGFELVTLKRYSRKRDVVTLSPENDDFSPQVIDLSSYDPESQEPAPFRIAGILAGLLRAGSPK